MLEYVKKTAGQIQTRVWLVTASLQLLGSLAAWLAYTQMELAWPVALGIFVVISVVMSYASGWAAGYLATIPLTALGNVILHVSPSQTAVQAPQTDKLAVGREYVASLAYQLYQVASLQDNKLLAEHKREATQASNILSHLPLPLFVFNKQQIITFGSDSALDYCQLESAELFGKPLFEAVDLEFPSDFTLEGWINDCQKNKATDTAYWQRVRVRLKSDGSFRQCDMAGYYNRDNPTGIEFIVTLFDRTQEYNQDDKSLGFVALAVHELRTPLTLMRGYIEVFEDELADTLDPEMVEFMHRMRAAAQQLSAFVNNILNVARIEENQLSVQLSKEDWSDVIHHAGGDMEMRAKPLGKTIVYDIAANLPDVAVDRVTMYEVLCNLLDNAVKYSDKDSQITLKAVETKDGLIETTIQDHGVGIPTSVIPNLFEKFHRNHRNKAKISGTGLGLYLSKTIVNAHGGDIWVKSKENQGTTVGFTVVPYATLADELKNGDNKDAMVRTAHGWIKNHSLYRR